MGQAEIAAQLKEFGLPEKAAEYYAGLEAGQNQAYLAAFRFVRPLNRRLEEYEGEYADWIRKWAGDGSVSGSPELAALLGAGATPEQIAKFAYTVALEAYSEVLYRLSDAGGGDYDLEDEGDSLPSWRLAERAASRAFTGRWVPELHGLIPFKNL